MSTITVHHLENSRSQRVLWLLEELERAYELRRYERDPKTMRAPDALRQLHPLGKSPMIEIDGRILAETGAIVETLIDDHGRQLRPEPGTAAFDRYRYFLHYAEGSLMPPLLVQLVAERIASAPVPFFLKPLTKRIAGQVEGGYSAPELQRHFAFLEGELDGRDYFAGEAFTAADVLLSFGIEAAFARGLTRGERPRLRAWLDRMQARPAYQRALERGGPYAYA